MKLTKVAVSLALMLLIAFGQASYSEGNVAFASPPATQADPHGGLKTAVKKTNSSRDRGYRLCLLLHKGHLIRVNNTLPPYLKHIEETINGSCQPEQTTVQEEKPPEGAASNFQRDEDKPEEKSQKEAKSGSSTVKTCDGASIELKADEKRVLDLHNEVRNKQGLETLCVQPKLTEAARAHSKEMIDENYFSHTSKNGQTPDARLKRVGYDWRAYGENIAWGSGSYSTPESTLDRWMKSPGHRKNIVNGQFREIGVGSVSGNFKGAGGATIYTVDFGIRRR